MNVVAKSPGLSATCVPVSLPRTFWIVFWFSFYEGASNVRRPRLPPRTARSIFIASWPPCIFHPPVLVSTSGDARISLSPFHMFKTTAVPLGSYPWWPKLHPFQAGHAHLTLPNHFLTHFWYVFVFLPNKRVIAIFHSGFDLPFLYLCIYKMDSIDDYPFNLRCQLVRMHFIGLIKW